MSMPNWLNDVQPFPSTDNGAFNPAGDPTMAFMQTPTPTSFEFNQMQNQQLQQRMQNGNARNGSPAYNPMYPTQPLIPSKRPRPREDSIGESPRQIPGALPASRSQTPQGAYPGFQGAINGNQQFSGTPSYQQFQQAGNNPIQSPIMPNQSFNPQASQQRVQTMSPSPFSPATQSFGGTHASPPQSEHGSRVNTPQNGGPHYAQAMPYGTGPGQSFTPPIGTTVNGAALSQYNQQSQAHQQQQLRIQQDALRMRQLQQFRQQGGTLNHLGQPSNNMSAGQIAALRAQQPPTRPDNHGQLLQAIAHFMQQNQLPFIDRPIIAGRPINSVQVFASVLKMGGSKRVSGTGSWPKAAQLLGLVQEPSISVGRELQNYWHTNLLPYETYMLQQQQQQRQAMADHARLPNHNQSGDGNLRQETFSPTKQMHNQQGQQLMHPPPHMHAQYQTPQRHIITTQHEARPPPHNGYMTPQQGQAQGRPSNVYSMPQLGLQAPPRTGPLKESQRPPTAVKKEADETRTPRKSEIKDGRLELKTVALDEHKVFDASSLDNGDTAPTYGGIELAPASNFLGTVDDLLKYKFSVPKVEELGVIDIRALTLSLRSGIHGEVRLALDTLASLTIEQNPLPLDDCEDLLEALIDCAEDQVDLLADHATEVSDAILISSYEEIARGCKIEHAMLQSVPEVGTLDYDLDRAVDRLICVTTILRNFSFLEHNHTALADPMVIRFMTTVIRYLGTRTMLLRTNVNALDFSKDVLTFLTNVSQRIDLPGKEEALCILHFLLSFAPSPAPQSAENEEILFSSYIPKTHRYFPHAVDSLAKLLARGDPNRSFYRSIFAADSASAPPYDLLTRAFGLAIAAIPEYGHINTAGIVKLRAPYLVQGLLAAEIIVSLIPATEHELAYTWVTSRDGFIFSLTRIVSEFSRQPQHPPQQRHAGGRMPENDPHGIITITNRGLAVLKKLAEKAKDAFGSVTGLPPEVMPDKRSVLSALVHSNTGETIVAMLCGISGLDA